MTPEEYRAEFDRVWPWLEKAANNDAVTETPESVWQRIEDGRLDLWSTPNSAVVTSIEVYGSGMKELRCWLAGGDLTEIQTIEPAIAQFGRANGCKQISILGRRGWLRALDGYQQTAVILTKGL